MIVVRYNNTTDLNLVDEMGRKIKAITNEPTIAIPQDWDILFNCSTNELYNFIKEIESIIRAKDIIKENQ